uniref:Putative vitellogenin receptor ixodes scapularis vitellogenin receptor n=1 Tax=Amblyomma cajennense TaxID=34607 RepID=A0A023FLL9_AMBCJ
MRRALFTKDLDEPRAIVVNPLEGWMYWTDWGEAAQRLSVPAWMARTGLPLSPQTSFGPTGLTIDFITKRLFWVDAKLHLISSADYDGSNRRVVLSSPLMVKHPFSIDVFEDWLYWTDWESEVINKVNKFNGHNLTHIANGVFSPMDVHVYHSYKQPQGVNYCEQANGMCSHFCLPAPVLSTHSARYSCSCPIGMELEEDGRNCRIMAPTAAPTTSHDATVPAVTDETVAYNTSQVDGHSAEASMDRRNLFSKLGSGHIAGIVMGVLGSLAVIITLVAYLVYRQYLRRNITSMNFDNPVYRKTTEDQFSLEKNQYQPARAYPPSMEPLTSPGTNEFV